jgi:hypothetical protein
MERHPFEQARADSFAHLTRGDGNAPRLTCNGSELAESVAKTQPVRQRDSS